MRYLAEPFALGALRRGRAIEQFLGPAGSPEHPGVRYVEVVPVSTHYEIFLHTLEDVGHETFADLVEFPPLDPDNEEEEFGLLLATRDDPHAALETAEEATGAVRGKWVNAGLAQDEYHDYLSAGRPRKTDPHGHPWPPFPS
ncbi:hypothetical protein [Streptomyces cylindrosporus]|uniref:Uncharacterized protein n=1 Tax=Streptomyces cylindrosporus TaxID=2927583 RepID=A0ABS9YKA3_9ACTN|nr:hypothetical protein [Streptomyces cylindrosporus]MCI3277001.1 hypothetical protein [Streptomyces cylindrosporus]